MKCASTRSMFLQLPPKPGTFQTDCLIMQHDRESRSRLGKIPCAVRQSFQSYSGVAL